MEIKPIRHALMPKFFAVAAALAAAGTLTGCGTAGEVAQPTGLVPVEVDPAAATEMRLEGGAPIETEAETETETETDEIIELAGDVEAVCDTSEACETEEFMLAGDVDVDYEPETVCETETDERLCSPGVFNLDDDPSAKYDTENAAEQNEMAAEWGISHADSFQKAFAAYDITLAENTGCTFDSMQSVWSSTETPPRVVIYFYDGCGVHEGVKMKDFLRGAFGNAEGLRVMDWGLAYDNEITYTAYIDVSELYELNDEVAATIAKELLSHESDTASD